MEKTKRQEAGQRKIAVNKFLKAIDSMTIYETVFMER